MKKNLNTRLEALYKTNFSEEEDQLILESFFVSLAVLLPRPVLYDIWGNKKKNLQKIPFEVKLFLRFGFLFKGEYYYQYLKFHGIKSKNKMIKFLIYGLNKYLNSKNECPG